MASLISEISTHTKNKNQLLKSIQLGRLHPVQIFVGSSGVGKCKMALALAQVLLCEHQSGCGQCGPCLRVARKQSESLLLIEPQGSFIKVEQGRQILDFLSLRSLGSKRVILVEEAHKLNPQTANLLLKTLEEPPEGVYFFLLTPSWFSLLATVRSRGQATVFTPLSVQELESLLPGLEDWVYTASQGRMDLAQNLSADDVSALREEALKQFVQLLVSPNKSRGGVLESLKESFKDRDKALFIVKCWQQLVRDCGVYKVQASLPLIHGDQSRHLETLAGFDKSRIFSIYLDLLQLEQDVLGPVDKLLAFENFFIEQQNEVSSYVV